MEWSNNEVVMEFLTLYENEPIIWNAKHPEHKNRNKVHDAWKRIQDTMSIKCTIAELKKKKECLMATFRPLCRKVKATSGTGTGADEVFKPSWFAYEKMANFLQGTCEPRNTQNTEELGNLNVDEPFEQIPVESVEYANTAEKTTEGNVALETVTSNPQSGPSNYNAPSKHFKVPGNTKTNQKRKAIDEVQGRMDEAYNILKKAVNVEKSTPSSTSLYGQLVAQKLEALDPIERVVAMNEIDNLLFRATMQHIGRQTYNLYSSNSNNNNNNTTLPQCSSNIRYYVNNFSPNDQQSGCLSSSSQHSSAPSPTPYYPDHNTPQASPSPSASQISSEESQSNETPASHRLFFNM